jgi:exodeoxyribonuclease-3
MKLMSWNVNGLRAVINKGFTDFLDEHQPDILCLQEIKAEASQVDQAFADGYKSYWNSAEKKGYSGTLILTRQEPSSVVNGIGKKKHDKEGRVIALEYDDYHLVNVYTPNAQNELRRLDYREKEWDVDFLKYIKKLDKLKPVIFCGDLNVAHKEIDIARPKANRRNAGFTDEERAGFDNIVAAGFIDSFREFNQEPSQYTWWSFRSGAREKNIGWRLDYFCVSKKHRDRLKDAFILQEVMGSDHCPVGIEFV